MSALSAPSAGISRREFARREHKSEKLIREAIKSGHLQTLADGSLDAALVGTEWCASNRRRPNAADPPAEEVRSVRTSSAPGVRTSAPGVRSSEPDEPAEAEAPDELVDVDDFVAGVRAGRVYKLAVSERIKEGALALKQVLAARQAAGDLVELALAEAVFFEQARGARDAWMNWPVRIGPLMAADLGLEADQVTELLVKYVHEHLVELGEPDPDFAPRE